MSEQPTNAGHASQENVEIVRQMHAAWSKTPTEPPLELFDDDVEWHTGWPGLQGVYHGHAGVRRWTVEVVEPMSMSIELKAIRSVDADCVFVEWHARGTGRGSGIDVNMPIFDLLTLRERRITLRRTFYDRGEALRAAGLTE